MFHNTLLRSLRTLAMLAVLAVALTASAAYPKYMSVTTPEGRNITVTVLDDNIIKVTNTAPGQKARRGTASVLDESKRGEWLNPTGTGLSANICGMKISLTTKGLLTIDAGPGKMVSDSGLRPVDKQGRCVMALDVNANGAFYGAGERGLRLNMRGDTLVMYNRANYGYTGTDPRTSQTSISMPLFLASDGYAIVFDDFGAAEMVLGNPIKYFTESPEPVTWYFINGAKTLADVSEGLSRLTGRQDLPPFWSLGYITSKYGYHNRSEAQGCIDSLRAGGYPVDGMVLDLYWYGKEQDMGRLAWDTVQWPDPKEFLDSMRRQDVHMITIAQPFVLRNGRGIDNYNKLAPAGMFMADSTGKNPQEVVIWVGEGGLIDVSNPDTRKWMTDTYRSLTDLGLSGWWGDLGEPEKHPENGLHHNGLTGRQYHNRYGNDWSEIIYDMYSKYYPDQRVLTMMRAGTTGLQRYSIFPWSGDVSRSWGGLEPQIRIMLNSGLSGLAYMGHDVGGFAVDNKTPTDPELYVRWLQLGLFSPMLRTHAQFGAEPYHYPRQQDIILPLIKERYRWLPYNYTLAWENATKGYPLVRPLNFHTPLATPDPAVNAIDDEFLWGRDVLVAPVLAKGATSRNVVLPAGSEWVDFSHPAKYYKGGTTIKDYPAPLNVLPLFVRAGSFIPLAEYPMDNTGDYNPSVLAVRYYPAPGTKTQSVMFEDDRAIPTSKSGNNGRIITFTGDDTAATTEVAVSASGHFSGMDAQKTVTLTIYGRNAEPHKVTVNGRKAKFTYSAADKAVTLTFKWRTDKPAVIRLIPNK